MTTMRPHYVGVLSGRQVEPGLLSGMMPLWTLQREETSFLGSFTLANTSAVGKLSDSPKG